MMTLTTDPPGGARLVCDGCGAMIAQGRTQARCLEEADRLGFQVRRVNGHTRYYCATCGPAWEKAERQRVESKTL